ncbi:MAG: hypothetical protein AAF360_17350 [Pseudomonadota bacterium]
MSGDIDGDGVGDITISGDAGAGILNTARRSLQVSNIGFGGLALGGDTPGGGCEDNRTAGGGVADVLTG